MTKEQTKKCIEVMQDYVDEKKVESRASKSNVFEDVPNPFWAWDCCEYRIKPEPKVRPYANAEEFLYDMKHHGPMIQYEDIGGRNFMMPMRVADDSVFLSNPLCYATHHFENLLEYHWQDGTPCGIIEE